MWKGEGGGDGGRARGVFKQVWGRVGSPIAKSCEVVSGCKGRLPNVGVGGSSYGPSVLGRVIFTWPVAVR